MTLPFLPPCQIPAMSTCLQLQATTEPLQRFVEYVNSTQVQSNSWPHSCRSVYKQQIHTNNDVEGWHNSLNKQEKPRSPFTLLVQLLHKEAWLVALQIKSVSERKLTKLLKKTYHSIQAKILSYWEHYAYHQKSAAQLFKACSHVNGPVDQN